MTLRKSMLIGAAVLGLGMAACDSGSETAEIDATTEAAPIESTDTMGTTSDTMDAPADSSAMGETTEDEETLRRPSSVEGSETMEEELGNESPNGVDGAAGTTTDEGMTGTGTTEDTNP